MEDSALAATGIIIGTILGRKTDGIRLKRRLVDYGIKAFLRESGLGVTKVTNN
jgi:hypothetical protein